MSEGLTPLQAYDHVMRFAARRGDGALRLAMHAAVPQVLRPELVHLLRLNFVPESLNDASAEADVLFASFCDDLGNGYFRFDPNARWRLLVHLDPSYESRATLRSKQVAGFLLTFFDEELRRVNASRDPVYDAYVEVERWVAFAFSQPESAASQLAAVIRASCDSETIAAKFRIAGLTSALSTPLAQHHALLAYAAGVELLQQGDAAAARDVLESLGDREFEIGGVKLSSPREILRQRDLREAQARKPEQAAPVSPEQQLGRELLFFVSYSSLDEGAYLDEFFNHLHQAVREMIGARAGSEIGFIRVAKLDLGEDWDSGVFDALNRTQVVIALLSPSFFGSERCARELGFFAKRMGERAGPPRILPVLWIRPADHEFIIPEVFTRMQLVLGDPSAVHNTKGVRHLVRLRKEFAAEYAELISTLARSIVEASRDSIPSLEPPPAPNEVVPFWRVPDPKAPEQRSIPGRVYISYRRGDAEGSAGRLRDHLIQRLGPAGVFDDSNVILPNQDFVGEEAVRSAVAVIVVIGRHWLSMSDASGELRIDNPGDFVRREIAAAIAAGVPLIPVLVDGATLPAQTSLPSDIAGLVRWQLVNLQTDRWEEGIHRLVEGIESLKSKVASTRPSNLTNSQRSGLAGLLVENGVVDEVAMVTALQAAKEHKSSFVTQLIAADAVNALDIAVAASTEFAVPLLDLDAFVVDPDTAKLVQDKLIQKHRCLPLYRRGKRLYLAMSDPTNLHALDEIKFQTGLSTEAVVVEDDKLQKAIDKGAEQADTATA